MVLVFSAHANNSPQVRREVERAINKGLKIVPLRVEDIKPAGALEYALSSTHWLDAFEPAADGHMARLTQAVKALLTGGNVGENLTRTATSVTVAPSEGPRPISQRITIWAVVALTCFLAIASCILVTFAVGWVWIGSGKDKPPPPNPIEVPSAPKEWYWDFHEGRLPDGWKGDGFRIVPLDDRNWLQVSKPSGHHVATLPRLSPALNGDFYVQGEYLISTTQGATKLTVHLEKTKTPLPMVVTINAHGAVFFGDDRHLPLPTFKRNLPATFRLAREGKTLSVAIRGENVAKTPIAEVIEYDTIRIGMDADGERNAGDFVRLSSLRVVPLPPSKE
jgi:hypothetical protein